MTTTSRPSVEVLLSGGVDSSALCHFLKASGWHVRGVFVAFGQASEAHERAAAQSVSDFYEIELRCLRLTGSCRYGSGEIRGRNTFLIHSALLTAEASVSGVGIGIHAGTAYYDCSELFAEQMKRLVLEQTDGRVSLEAPFLHWSKNDIYSYAAQEHVPIHLTYSCESGAMPPCEHCLSCQDRRKFNAG